MQNLPDRDVLLQAVAGFLVQDVVPNLSDRGLAFRVRIAAHLVATLSRELQTEEADDAAQLRRLAEALGQELPAPEPGRNARHAAIRSRGPGGCPRREVDPDSPEGRPPARSRRTSPPA